MARKPECILRLGSIVVLIVLLLGLSLPASAESGKATLTTTVPSHCCLWVDITGRGIVFIGSNKVTTSQAITIQRHKQIEIIFQPSIGYQLAEVSLNGEDMSQYIHAGKLILDGLSADSELPVIFLRKDSVWPGSNPPTGDSIIKSLFCCGLSLLTILYLLNRKRDK